MYKPNGEEPMTKQEEMRRKEAIVARIGKDAKPGNIRSAFYAALFGAASSRQESVGSSFEQARY